MNPFIFNVETYYMKKRPASDSRDPLDRDSAYSEGHKLRSAVKFLSGLADRKGGIFLVGGVLAVGCTIRFLRNGRKRRNAKRASHIDIGTQTDPFPDLVPDENTSATGSEGGAAETVASNEHPKMFHEARRSLSPVTEPSDDHSPSKSDCPSKAKDDITSATKVSRKQHSCCQLSTVLALFALHKVSIGEISASVKKCHCQENKGATGQDKTKEASWLFNPGTKPPTSALSKKGFSPCLDKPSGNAMHILQQHVLQVRDRTQKVESNGAQPSSKKESVIQHAPPSSDHRSNPFDVQGQDTALSTHENETRGKAVSKNDCYSPRTQWANGRAKSIFEQAKTTAQDTAAAETAEKQSEGHKAPIAPSSDWRNESGRSRQRGKRIRRGRDRRNNNRRQYFDLDSPPPIASQQRR